MSRASLLRTGHLAGVGAIVLLLIVGTLSIVPVNAQTSPPNSYYGTAESASGTPAQQGTTIVAVANGEVQDSITIGTDGQYGSSEPTGEKLRVSSDIDSTVTFHIDNASGPQAEETDPDPEGDVERFDLTFPAGTFGGPETPLTSTPTSTATTTGTATETTTGTATETTTEIGTAGETETTETGTQGQGGTTSTAEAGSETGDSTASDPDSQLEDDGDSDSQEVVTASTTPAVVTRTQGGTLLISNASLNRTQMPPGGTVLVTATLQNTGNGSVSAPISLVVNDTTVTTRTYTLEPGTTRSVEFSYETNETGEFPVSVASAQAGTLTVGQSGGLIPWGLLRPVFLFLVLPIALIYGVLKALAIYYGY